MSEENTGVPSRRLPSQSIPCVPGQALSQKQLMRQTIQDAEEHIVQQTSQLLAGTALSSIHA
jgi:hypothetical protein